MSLPKNHPGVKLSGAPNKNEVKESPGYPKEESWGKGPLAFIECVEEIPCNPCESACPRGAITVGSPITNLPVLDVKKCIGCGICIPACPGMAIYVKNFLFSETRSTIAFSYEYWPLPAKGQEVTLVNELGEPVCQGEVVLVVNTTRNNQTPLVTVSYPREHFESVKYMSRCNRT